MEETFKLTNIHPISGSVFCDSIEYTLTGKDKTKIMAAKGGNGGLIKLDVNTYDVHGNEVPNTGGLYIVSPRPCGELVESVFVTYEGGEVYADIC